MGINHYTSMYKQPQITGDDMVDTVKPVEKAMVECEVCLKEVPKSAAKSVETSDYVHHFCGVECYSQWKEQAESEEQ